MNKRITPTKLKTVQILVSGIAVILGLIYLNTEWIPLSTLLPVFAVLFTALPILQIIDIKQQGLKGILPLLPPLCYLLLAMAVIAATIIYFVRY